MSDKDNDSFELSRRKALAGIGGIGTATALGGIGTYAQFTDTENATMTFSAGGIDGTLSWGATYNSSGDTLDTDEIVQEPTQQQNGVGLSLELEDVKPGTTVRLRSVLRSRTTLRGLLPVSASKVTQTTSTTSQRSKQIVTLSLLTLTTMVSSTQRMVALLRNSWRGRREPVHHSVLHEGESRLWRRSARIDVLRRRLAELRLQPRRRPHLQSDWGWYQPGRCRDQRRVLEQ